jgi:transposase
VTKNLRQRLVDCIGRADNVMMMRAKYSTYEVRVRAVQAVHDGMTVTQVARAYDVDRTTLQRWLARYRQEGGDEGLQRQPGSGRPRKLGEITREQWRALILKPASKFGFETDFWTAKRLHHVRSTNGKTVNPLSTFRGEVQKYGGSMMSYPQRRERPWRCWAWTRRPTGGTEHPPNNSPEMPVTLSRNVGFTPIYIAHLHWSGSMALLATLSLTTGCSAKKGLAQS